MRSNGSRQTIAETHGLGYTFRTGKTTVQAVHDLDLTIRRGEIVGFLGPNGAGKTTTIRMLTTLLAPTAGEATIAGCDLRRDPAGVRGRIGYVAQAGGTDERCRVREELVQQARFYRHTPMEAERRAAELYSRLDLEGLGDRLIKTLSGGQRRRLDIAMGLINAPALLFLDEPTTGLDPQARSNLWEHIRRLREELGTTVFLTTHYMDEADALCDRILVIDRGNIVAEGGPDDLKRRISGDVVTVQVGGDSQRAHGLLAHHAGVREASISGQTLRLTVESGDQALMAVMRTLGAAGLDVAAIQLHRPTLEDVFLHLTGRTLREAVVT